MNLSKLWEIEEGRGAWHAAVYGVAKSQTQFSDPTAAIWWHLMETAISFPSWLIMLNILFCAYSPLLYCLLVKYFFLIFYLFCIEVFASVDLKNNHNLDVESYVLFLGVQAQKIAPERTLLRRWGEWGGENLHRNFPLGAGSLKIKRLLLIQ